jgi:hypothetical protein
MDGCGHWSLAQREALRRPILAASGSEVRRHADGFILSGTF